MHRPLREPLYLRLWRLVRGIMLYNTIDWNRASDGLNMPSMTNEERERQRPQRNLEIIKPRVMRRGHIEASRGGELYEPEVTLPTPASDEHFHPPKEEKEDTLTAAATTEAVPDADAEAPAAAAQEETVIYKRRRRYRRRISARGSDADRGGFVARIFGRKP